MAAHILLNLDPDTTEHPSKGEGWACDWLYTGAEYEVEFLQRPATEAARFTRDDALSVAFEGVSRLTALADPLQVRMPQQWLAWAEKNGLLRPWLAAGAAKLGGSYFSLAERPGTQSPKPPNPISSAGGKARAKKSEVGSVKTELSARIEAWLDTNDGGTARAFASELRAELEQGADYVRDPDRGPTQETIETWIRQSKQARSRLG